ncbi:MULTISPECIES: AAA family ATPase [unclassified Acinetobacter]|uniref:AAA family ATPase n=1 Tax=unclassified Acinetobacter TaxID=196816 RepID=UPI0019092FC2|nr:MULTISPECIES: AAA family ATPase [unclassified Acinetobacter]MBK0062817.1 AAA family ATPase [Acinetobacter sp. S55]MBK0065606.1 AAA family ATPase [Acinetobacter sp. S54]
MKLESIHLKHTSLFSHLQVQFHYSNKPITLILGEQATGKTTLLKHIYQALSWFPARLKDNRTAGVVMLDQDILNSRIQSRIDIQIRIPSEIGQLAEGSQSQQNDNSVCTWKLYKTLNSQGVGISQTETQQLEELTALYQKAIKQDPLQGLPCIAYYPADRFINEVNLLSKNIPAVFQPSSAYDVAAIPFTTFARFFEWFREISDIENAQSAQLLQHILGKFNAESLQNLEQEIFQTHAQLNSPNLQALKTSLNVVFPDITDIYLQYQPKLQLMVTYQGQSLAYQQLSNSIKTWIALVGDIVRRLCLLNPLSLYPCLEGDGIVLIDHIDAQLDHILCREILERLHQAFPRLQLIVTGNREELLEHGVDYQCLSLSNKQISTLELESSHHIYETVYQNLFNPSTAPDLNDLSPSALVETDFDQVLQLLEHLSNTQKEQILQHLQSNTKPLDESRLSEK